jgi:hypothetical protein
LGTHFYPGQEAFLASDSPASSFSGVFGYDGETGYFYALDRAEHQNPILDAVHIYNAANVLDRDKASEAQIVWSRDGLKAGRLINGYLHALLDFEAKKAYSRRNFPPPGGAWVSPERLPWDDSIAELLR